MRRTVRVAGWVLKAVLLAVCLGAVWVWGLSAWDSRMLWYVVARPAPPGTAYRIHVVAWSGSGAWVGRTRVVLPAVGTNERADSQRGYLDSRRRWWASPVLEYPPWAQSEVEWHGWGRLGLAGWDVRREWGTVRGWRAGAPLWAVVLVTGAWPAASLWRAGRGRARRRRAARDGLCPSCGYDWRATPGRCPECGLGAGDDAGRAAG